MPSLKFLNGQFVFRDKTGFDQCITLKAAAEFRRFADEKAEKVLNRAFNKIYDLPSLPQLTFLDPHQREGVEWALSRSRSYLAHAPGAGKTCELICVAELAKGPGQTIIIVPPDMTDHWAKEILKFTGFFNNWPAITVVPTTDKKHLIEWRADYIIVPDSMLTKEWVYTPLSKMKIKVLAVDEASRFKEGTAERSKVFYGGVSNSKVRHFGLYQEATHVVFLDGSPMPNRPMELWAPTYALDPMAIDCMDQNDFGFKYCGAQINDFGKWEFRHSSNEEELQRRLRKTFMHVVTEAELTHPERLRKIVYTTGDVATSEIKEWGQHFEIPTDETKIPGELATLRRKIGIAKINWVARYTKHHLEKNQSILLFAWHREVIEGLADLLSEYKPGVIMGGVKNDDRAGIRESFQNRGTKVIVANIVTLGRGHNLQRGDRAIFGEFSWTEELNKQCEKRIARRGRESKLPLPCDYIAVPNSLDEVVLKSNFTKERRVKRIVG